MGVLSTEERIRSAAMTGHPADTAWAHIAHILLLSLLIDALELLSGLKMFHRGTVITETRKSVHSSSHAGSRLAGMSTSLTTRQGCDYHTCVHVDQILHMIRCCYSSNVSDGNYG